MFTRDPAKKRSTSKSSDFIGRLVVAALLFFPSLGADATKCETSSEFGSQQEYSLEDPLNLSIVGFESSIRYVSAPDLSVAALKITSASKEASVSFVNGTLTITSATCEPDETTSSPTSSPSSSAATRNLALSATIMSLFAFPGMGPMVLATSLFALLAGVQAEDNCMPSLDIEISVPVDCPYNNFVKGECLTPKMIADMTVQALFVNFDVDAAATLLAEDYIQHNPTVPTGAAPIIGFLPALQANGVEIETHRTIAEGNLVAYHSTYTNATLFGGETLIGFDVFRIEDGLVQEHWDNLQPKAGPNPSGNSMVDGPTMIKYLQDTEANKELSLGLVQAVLIGGNASAAPNFISSTEYTQHNPDIADGLEGLAEALAFLASQNTSFVYDSVDLVVSEGNFVMTGSTGEFGAGNPTAYYDLFRVEDGMIVEHWDVIQGIPPPEEFAHSNGKF